MDISEYYDEISQCNKCGFCQVACPIFRSTGHESGVARGRLALLRALIEGRLDWDKALEEPLYDCLGCGACTSNSSRSFVRLSSNWTWTARFFRDCS